MPDIAQTFVSESRRLLTTDYLQKIERSVAVLGDEDIWWRPNEVSNSIGNLVLHLCGNLQQWIIGGVGGRAYERDRQREFDERTPRPAPELLARLRAVVSEAGEIIGALDADALQERRQIQGEELTVFEAVYHVIEHFSMHTGQVIYISKMRAGQDLKLW